MKKYFYKIIPLIFCLLGLWVFHQKEIRSQFTQHPGDLGDARFVVYTLEHVYKSFSGNASLLSPSIFYPEKNTLGFSDPLIGFSPPYIAARKWGAKPFVASSLTFIFWNFVTFWVAYVLLRKFFKLNVFFSTFAATFLNFSSIKLNQMPHLQLQPLVYVLLFLSCLYWAISKEKVLSEKKFFTLLCVSALSLNLQLISAFYMAWFSVFFVLLYTLAWGFTHSFKNTLAQFKVVYKNRKKALQGVATVFVVTLIPFICIYYPTLLDLRVRRFSETLPMIPNALSFFSMGTNNWAWGVLSKWNLTETHPELQIGFGLILTTLWIFITYKTVGSIKTLAKNYPFFVPLVITINLFFLLGFRINNISAWTLVFFTVPGAMAARAVARYTLLISLPMILTVATLFQKQFKKYSVAVIVLCFLILIEQGGKVPTFDSKTNWKYLVGLGQKMPNDCKSFYIKADANYPNIDEAIQIDAMFVSLLTGLPTLNGYSGFKPRQWPLSDPKEPNTKKYAQEWAKEKGLDHTPCELSI